MNRRHVLAVGFASFTAKALGLKSALAQSEYPDRPIKLLVPFSAGGVVDVIGRLWADRMKSELGTVFVENQGGAGGIIGAAQVARADPDGYTILLGNSSTQVLTPAVMTAPPYDPINDFVAVSLICFSATSIVVNPSLPAHSLQQLIAYAKSNPNKMSYGSAGAGTMTHLAGEMFKQLTGMPAIVHIPYKGAGPGIADLVSGHIPLMTPNITGQLLDLHRAKKVRILAVNAPVRINGAPDIPTAIEGGIPGMVVQVFNGLFAPAKTPRLIVDRIAQSTRLALADKEFQAALIRSGFEPAIDPSPETAAQFINEEHARLTPVVRSLGFTIN